MCLNSVPFPNSPWCSILLQYVVSDPGVLGTTVTVKTSDLQVVNIPVPADCPIGAVLSYMY
jgi:hypothetical protein